MGGRKKKEVFNVCKKLIDLHTHSTCSDGSMSPRELVRHAASKGLAAIALSDHDSVAGVKDAMDEGKRVGVEVVPAIELSALLSVPVFAANDANNAALGEAWKGGGMGCDNMVLATLGTGVGGGIIIGGKPVSGAHGAGGEIGHTPLRKDETEPCGCGKFGCAEQYCSATGVVRVTKRYLDAHDTPSVLRDLETLTAKDIFDAAKAGDAAAQEALEQVYDLMGQFLASICCVADPEVVVLGGGVSRAGQPLLDGTRKYFDRYVFHASRNTRFALASLGNDAGAYGAFKLALDSVK